MNGAQGAILGLGALIVVGVGVALFSGGGGDAANGDGLADGTPKTVSTANQTSVEGDSSGYLRRASGGINRAR